MILKQKIKKYPYLKTNNSNFYSLIHLFRVKDNSNRAVSF